MNIDFDYFRAVQNMYDEDSFVSSDLDVGSEDIAEWMRESVGFRQNALRNGKRQSFILKRSETLHKADVVCMPGDDLCIGDIVEIDGLTWLVTKLNETNPFQKIGLLWLCNLKFKWQDFDKKIHEQWCVLDTGTYSTSITHDFDVQAIHKQYKVYMPLNEYTSHIYINLRFATSRHYNQLEELILDTYKVTSFDPVSQSYGVNAHMLMFSVESSQFDAETDNVELMVCDYKEDNRNPEPISMDIVGSERIRLGKSRMYHTDAATPDSIEWTLEAPDGVSYELDEDKNITIFTENNDELLGNTLIIKAHDVNGVYSDAEKKVEVVSFG